MANRYWVGGTANWDTTAGTKWSLTDGGAGGEAVPTNADDVFFTASSGAVTVTVSSNSRACKNLNFTGFTGTFAGSSTITDLKGSLTFSSGMTLTHSGTITFTATSSQTITTNGILVKENFTFNGIGGSWTLQDDFTNNTRTVTLTNGTFNANNKNLTIGSFASSNSNTRTITMGSGTWTLIGSATVWDTGTSTNLTLNYNTSTIKYVGKLGYSSSSTFVGNNTFYNLVLDELNTANYLNFNSSNTFNNIELKAGNTAKFVGGKTQTVSSFTAVGTSGSRISMIGLDIGSGLGWSIIDSSGTNTVSYCDIRDSNASGGAVWDASDGTNTDNGNNTGWVFPKASGNFFQFM